MGKIATIIRSLTGFILLLLPLYSLAQVPVQYFYPYGVDPYYYGTYTPDYYEAQVNPNLTIKNDTEQPITENYSATIIDRNQELQIINSTIPLKSNSIISPPLPDYLVKEQISFTEDFDGCFSTVRFLVSHDTGEFNITDPITRGAVCETEVGPKRLKGTLLEDGWTILLSEIPAEDTESARD